MAKFKIFYLTEVKEPDPTFKDASDEAWMPLSFTFKNTKEAINWLKDNAEREGIVMIAQIRKIYDLKLHEVRLVDLKEK